MSQYLASCTAIFMWSNLTRPSSLTLVTGTTRSQTCKEGPIKYRQHQPVSRLVHQLFVSLLVTTWEECLLHDGGFPETEATDCSNNEDAVKAFSVHLHLYI